MAVSTWFGRSLENYIIRNKKLAISKKLWDKLQDARTLTEARKIMRGVL